MYDYWSENGVWLVIYIEKCKLGKLNADIQHIYTTVSIKIYVNV